MDDRDRLAAILHEDGMTWLLCPHSPENEWQPCEALADRLIAAGVGFPDDRLREALDMCGGCPHPVHDGSCDKPGLPGASWMCNCRWAVEVEMHDVGNLIRRKREGADR